jgi:hypothetical protein
MTRRRGLDGATVGTGGRVVGGRGPEGVRRGRDRTRRERQRLEEVRAAAGRDDRSGRDERRSAAEQRATSVCCDDATTTSSIEARRAEGGGTECGSGALARLEVRRSGTSRRGGEEVGARERPRCRPSFMGAGGHRGKALLYS